MKTSPHVRVGVSAIVIKDGKVLLGKRKGSHGAGRWAFPGGHLEFGESLEGCLIREVQEETSLSVDHIRFVSVTNDIFTTEQKHYITIFMTCEYASGEVVNRELDKCEQWGWFAWDALPAPLFLPIEHLLKQSSVSFLDLHSST